MSPAPRRAPAQVVTSLMTLWANPATFYEVFRVMVWALGASSLSLAPVRSLTIRTCVYSAKCAQSHSWGMPMLCVRSSCNNSVCTPRAR